MKIFPSEIRKNLREHTCSLRTEGRTDRHAEGNTRV